MPASQPMQPAQFVCRWRMSDVKDRAHKREREREREATQTTSTDRLPGRTKSALELVVLEGKLS